MSIGKESTKNQTTAPTDPRVTNAYLDLLNQAKTATSKPYQSYNDQLVAGLNPTQTQAIDQIKTAGGLAQPYLDEAANYTRQSAQPISLQQFSPEAVSQYYSPYENDVVNSTMALQDKRNQEQLNKVRGAATAAGAFGGDRSAVLESSLMREQNLADNNTIANLKNQGYSQALGQFNTGNQMSLAQQQANSSNAANASGSLANLGLAGQGASLANAGALLQAGTQQQQTEQASDEAKYGEFLRQQGFPYQNLQFLSSILPGVAQGTGTTTNATDYKPFNWGSLIGLGNAYASGGRTRLAGGGAPLYAQTTSYVPEVEIPRFSTGQPSMSSSGLSYGQGDGKGLFGGSDGKGLFGGGDGKTDSPSMLEKAGKIGLAMFGLAHGGRTHLADGGIGDILNRLYPDQDQPDQPQDQPQAAPRSLADMPAPANDQGEAPAPRQSAPLWDDGAPVVANGGKGKTLWEAPGEPSVWQSVGRGLAGFLSTGNIGKGLQAGISDYDAQMDPHPEVDHSGPTILIKYGAPGKKAQLIDTGIPTEAAINARAMNDYRRSNLDMTQATREDSIAQRRTAAEALAQARQDAIEQRRQAAEAAADNRAAQLETARLAAEQGHYTYQPATQPDPDNPGKTVNGYLRLPTRGNEAPQFISGYTPLGKGTDATGMSGREGVYFNRVVSGANAATAAIKNIMELPGATSSGLFAGRGQPPGLLNAAKEALTNRLTSQDVQDYNALVPGVTRNLGVIETAGLSVPGSMTHSMEGTLLKEGDSEQTKLRKMAEMRQIIETGLEPNLSNPKIPEEQKALVRRIISDVQKAVPFTHHDVTALQQAENPQTTIGDIVQARGLGGGNVVPIPKKGAVVKGYRFKGGNPADKRNWEKAA